jgi:prepilin-type N-terminal cleavage/methylation domain-containing protein
MNAYPVRSRRAFSLMELLVVLSILALLAAVAVPKLIDMFERGRSATQAYSTADVARQIEIFYGLNHEYPDNWDSLTTDGGTIYTKLTPELRDLLIQAPLGTPQIDSLKSAGIGHVFLHDPSNDVPPSDSGTTSRHIGTGTSSHDGSANVNSLVAVDSTPGSKGESLLLNEFGLIPFHGGISRIAANTYVVLGLGQKSTMVQSQIQEAPLMEHGTSDRNYSRALAVFEVPNTGGGKAKLVGVIGPDGRTKQGSIKDFNNPQGVKPR